MIQFPELTLPKDRLIPTKNGLPTDLHGPDRRPDGPLRLYCDGVFLGIGKVEQGRVKLAVHLYE